MICRYCAKPIEYDYQYRSWELVGEGWPYYTHEHEPDLRVAETEVL